MTADYLPAASRAGHLRFTFNGTNTPYVLIEATRPSVVIYSDPSNITYPIGTVTINPAAREISGNNPERQDKIIGPNKAPSFSGYFVARFDTPFFAWGTASNTTLSLNATNSTGEILSGYAMFANGTKEVNVRVGVSFISVDQARKNLDNEVPDGQAFEQTAYNTRSAWKDKLELIQIEGATKSNLTTFYTAFFHSLQVRSGSIASWPPL